jgi:hypothetical protein
MVGSIEGLEFTCRTPVRTGRLPRKTTVEQGVAEGARPVRVEWMAEQESEVDRPGTGIDDSGNVKVGPEQALVHGWS